MKRISIFFFVSTFMSLNLRGQITKGNWMVGGNGNVSFKKQTLNGTESDGFGFLLSPAVGYFFADKVTSGVRTRIDIDKVKYSGGTIRTTLLGVGPFVRYYFLEKENRINLFAESKYEYIHISSKTPSSDDAHAFTFSAGPVIYLNTSVGIEFNLNYEVYNNNDLNAKLKTFYLAIGFQIHLEKETN